MKWLNNTNAKIVLIVKERLIYLLVDLNIDAAGLYGFTIFASIINLPIDRCKFVCYNNIVRMVQYLKMTDIK